MKLLTSFGILLGLTLITNPLTTNAQSDLDAEGDIRIYAIFVTRGVETATVTWKTNSKTKGRVEYAGPSGTWIKSPWSESYTNDHTLTLLKLSPDTTYLYRINAEDENGVLATKTETFKTLNAEIIGGQQPYPGLSPSSGQNSGFQNLLSPTPSLPYPYNNQQQPILGLQTIPVLPYYAMTNQPQPTPPPPTHTPTPTPTPVPPNTLTGNTTNLVLGLIIGISLSILLHQVTTRKMMQTKGQEKKEARQKTKLKKYQFDINP